MLEYEREGDRGLRALARARRLRRRRRCARRAARTVVEGRRLPRARRRCRRAARRARASRQGRGAARRAQAGGDAAPPARSRHQGARTGGDRVRATEARALHGAGPPRVRDRRRPRRRRGGRPCPARLHDQCDGPSSRRRGGRRSIRRPGRPERPGATDGLAAKLRRGSAPDRPRAPVRLPARARSRRRHARADARGSRGGRRSSRASGWVGGSQPTVWASSRSSCWAATRRRPSSSHATRACSSP